jgi:hypothetical protein
MASVPTIQIKVPPTPGNEAGIVTINETDFDPAQHVRADEEQPAAASSGESEARPSRRPRRESGTSWSQAP